jgi:voltage-gated potassium channel
MMIYQKIKKRTFEIIEKAEKGDIVSHLFDIFIMLLIVINILSVFVETFSISDELRNLLYKIEVFSVVVFSIEYLLRLWTANYLYEDLPPVLARIRYFFSFMALVDLFAILPFYIPFIIKVDLRILRILRLIRLLRVVKANRYTKSLHKVIDVIREKASELISAVFILLLLMIVSSVLIYYFEAPAQPDVYINALSGVWWSVSIFTSVWLGDIYPITTAGRILCAIMAVLGVAIIAVPTGIISSGFVENTDEENDEKMKLLKKIDNKLDELEKRLK